MTKHIVAVFAHPDDEAFGPCGTLLLETSAGSKLHLILLTAGEAGKNPTNAADLATQRLSEWQRSAELLGASSQHFLGYRDGQLANRDLPEICDQISQVIEQQTYDASEVEIISLEFGGITGHIDHIVAARAAACSFYKLKQTDQRFRKLRLFCLPIKLLPSEDSAWIFADKGYSPSQIDEIVDARHLKTDIDVVMDAHASQSEDAAYVRRLYADDFGLNWFIVHD